jgi:hypothetical protein
VHWKFNVEKQLVFAILIEANTLDFTKYWKVSVMVVFSCWNEKHWADKIRGNHRQ